MAKDFFQKVWLIVARIPYGKVASYGQIAALLGSPRAARMVGWALHSMPKNLEIPWHRVISARGLITYRHNPHLQRVLLEQEGIHFDEKDRVDMARYQWRPDHHELLALDKERNSVLSS